MTYAEWLEINPEMLSLPQREFGEQVWLYAQGQVRFNPKPEPEREHVIGDDGGTYIPWGEYPSTVVK